MNLKNFFTQKNIPLTGKIIFTIIIAIGVGYCLWGMTRALAMRNEVAQKQSTQIVQANDATSPERAGITSENKSVEWKTYRNKKYGYEVKYPTSWEVIEAKPREGNKAVWGVKILFEEEMQKVTFLEKEYEFWPGEFQVRVMSNKNNLTLEQWIDEHEPQDVTGGSLIQDISDRTLGRKPAKRLSIFGFDHEGIEIVTLHKGYIYSLNFTGSNPNDPKVEQHKKIYDQMVLSFTFME